ncbi:MAG TPA: calcium-binding protein [Solirubrobacteraceae bacterium]|nr:calcium-binding protein [Solirubrobacteraceae bacterium]
MTLLGVAICGGLAGTAQAQTAADTACRASAARVAVPAVNVTVEPVRANAPLNPCTSQSASTLQRTTIGPVTADAVGAFTDFKPTASTAGFASLSQPVVALPGLTVAADAVLATATATCQNGTPALAGSSRVAGLTINGSAIVLPPGDAPFQIPLGPLGRVAVNQEAADAATGTLKRQAVVVETPLATVVLAEAIAGATAAACTSGSGTVPLVCPPGSTPDPARNVCVIRETTGGGGTGGGGGGTGGGGSGGGGGGTTVGGPFEGPTGGSVMSLEEARKRFKSRCLGKKGPKFVIVGTKGRDRVTGTNRGDRILLRAGDDRSEGGRGNDCIDGNRGRDSLSGALGRDRLIGGSGGDALNGASDADRLVAGGGNDTINAGFGRDRVFGGKGADRINLATAGPAARVIRCGTGFDKIRVNFNEASKARKRKAGCERVYSIR